LKTRILFFALPAIVVIAAFSYSYFASNTAIVEAIILGTRLDENAGLRPSIWFWLSVNATKAFPNFPLFVKSDCNQTIGEHLYVGVKLSSQFEGYHPISHEAQLYKEGGFLNTGLNIGFVPWDGC